MDLCERAVFVVTTLFGLIAATFPTSAQSLHERGAYLVDAVMACDGCHTPRAGKTLDMSKRFSGGSQVWEEKAYTVRGEHYSRPRDRNWLLVS